MQCSRTIISKSETDEITKENAHFALKFMWTDQTIHSSYISNIETGNTKDSLVPIATHTLLPYHEHMLPLP